MATAGSIQNKTRSPNYPPISLPEALIKLSDIYEKQGRYPATREVLVKLMGYKGLNGASATVVSALSKYGLLEGHGDNLKVSDLGQDLILHRKGDPEYDDALQIAANSPVFFRELNEQFPNGLPSEHSLRATLIKRGFNPKSIDAAVRAYKDTMEFLSEQTSYQVSEFPSPQENKPINTPQDLSIPNTGSNLPTTSSAVSRTISLPLTAEKWASIQAPFPITEAEWDQMILVLQAMKPALVSINENTPNPIPATDEKGVE